MLPTVVTRSRLVELDRLRGLAIALMVADHLAAWVGLPVVELTVGRLAMPLFFVIAGHLVHRLSRRHAYVLLIGVALPFVVPWVDSPNVLVWFVVGAALLRFCDRFGVPSWWLIVLGLVLAANRWAVPVGFSYDPFAVVALMALGRGLEVGVFAGGARLPAWLGALGRRPLTWYVGHLLVLQLVLTAFGVTR